MSNWFSKAGPQTQKCYCSKLQGKKKSRHCECSSGKCVPRANSIKSIPKNFEDREIKALNKPEGIIITDKETFFSPDIKKDLSLKTLKTYSSLIQLNRHYIYSTSLNKIARSQDKAYTGGIKESLQELADKGYLKFKIDTNGVFIEHLKKISYSNKPVPSEYKENAVSLKSLPKASREIMKALESTESKELITTTRDLAQKTGCSSLQDIKKGIDTLVNNNLISAIRTSKGTILTKIEEEKG